MDLSTWVLREHPFFKELRKAIVDLLEVKGPLTLDETVILSRYPLRSVLLALELLIQKKQALTADNYLYTPAQSKRLEILDHPSSSPQSVFWIYLEATRQRVAPALLWSQRRLIPLSAYSRARYVLNWMNTPKGRVGFFGDDDLVSPLVAALVPTWEVEVLDIDSGVLDEVEASARAISATVRTIHSDLSRPASFAHPPYDIVVCDPFPTKDGTFERIFWQRAASTLGSGGILISTALPSHKPDDYSSGAFTELRSLGYEVLDQRYAHCQYEVFDFELTEHEQNFLRQIKQSATVHHTKCQFAARRNSSSLPSASAAQGKPCEVNWPQIFQGHYLTSAAGISRQRDIITTRGPIGTSIPENAPAFTPMAIELLHPSKYASKRHGNSNVEQWTPVEVFKRIKADFGAIPTDDEVAALHALAGGSGVGAALETRLALAVRALESWSR